MKAKHSKGKRYRAKGRTASRAVNAARRLKIIPIITRDMNRMADWLNATGVVQVAIIEAMQHYIDQVQACQPLDGFKLTDKVNDIVQAHIKAQQQVQPITEPIPTDLSHVGAELEQKYKDENATDPPST